jgi:hypothetical protein
MARAAAVQRIEMALGAGLAYVPGQAIINLPNGELLGQAQGALGRTLIEPLLLGSPKTEAAASTAMRFCAGSWQENPERLWDGWNAEVEWFERLKRTLTPLGAAVGRNAIHRVEVSQVEGLSDPLLERQYHLEAMRVQCLWERGIRGGPEIPIVIMDSGVEDTHEDLFYNVSAAEGSHFIGPDTADRLGHGTFVAGLVGAMAKNGKGGSGVSPLCRIISIKVLEQVYVLGTPTTIGTTQSVLQGYLHALSTIPGPLVIVNAFRTYEPMPEVLEVIRAGKKQFLVLAASGNDAGRQAANPGRYSLEAENVLCVTSLKPDWTLSSFGNIGTGVQLATLGEDLLSTYLNNGYAVGSGTSFSAALVAGLAGLVWPEAVRRGIGASPQFIANCLLRAADLDFNLIRFFNLSYLRDARRVWTEVERPVEPPRSRGAD